MAGDDAERFKMLELLIGLPDVAVLGIGRIDGVLEIYLESWEAERFCAVGGMAGVVKGWPVICYVGLPAFG